MRLSFLWNLNFDFELGLVNILMLLIHLKVYFVSLAEPFLFICVCALRIFLSRRKWGSNLISSLYVRSYLLAILKWLGGQLLKLFSRTVILTLHVHSMIVLFWASKQSPLDHLDADKMIMIRCPVRTMLHDCMTQPLLSQMIHDSPWWPSLISR